MSIEYAKILGLKLFISIERNKNCTYSVLYHKKYYKEVSTVVDHLLAYFLKLYEEGILLIFTLYYQDLSREAKWINEQPYYKNELDLNEKINKTVDLEWMIDEKLAAKKCVKIYKEEDTTIASFKTIDYIKGRAVDDSSNMSMDINEPILTST